MEGKEIILSSELGTLEETNMDDEAEKWDTQIDIDGVDSVLREVSNSVL
ncbi:unnamed protein product [Gongylonema pulchrum]|uniref:Skp1_POZ domain-containing protein n=1 Tax=Gongylonema pulchrum TaxID=637853 RepID=A0A183EPB8_9BILA|nr:unnamed protein product [Gongylonema pulchrum]